MGPLPPPPVAKGDMLAGKYRALDILGAGGMGVVVAAEHTQLHQRVALKFLLPEGLVNAQVVARFEREARAAAQLRSEHVARVIDVGRLETGGPYIVMELLDGCDLAALLQDRGPLPESEAVDYVIQACEAIAEAHSLGIIHRDLKPKNLFVTKSVDGSPLIKVLDFGISKTAADDLSLTGTTEVIGSPNYMSPEQLKASRDVDARSDIWSIGAILYEVLGGRVPFVATTLTQLCSLVLTEAPPPLGELRADLHPELLRVVDKCLEKDPARRFGSVGELAMALAPFASTAGSVLASRVAIVGGSGRLPPSHPASSSARVVPAGQGGSTSVSWGATELARGTPPRRAMALGVLVGAAVVGALATFVLRATSQREGTLTLAPPSSVAAAAAPPPVLAAGGATSATPAASAGPSVPSSAPSSSTPPVTSGPSAGQKPGPRPPKHATPRVANDDLPGDRK